jgi:hypothetical protein
MSGQVEDILYPVITLLGVARCYITTTGITIMTYEADPWIMVVILRIDRFFDIYIRIIRRTGEMHTDHKTPSASRTIK